MFIPFNVSTPLIASIIIDVDSLFVSCILFMYELKGFLNKTTTIK